MINIHAQMLRRKPKGYEYKIQRSLKRISQTKPFIANRKLSQIWVANKPKYEKIKGIGINGEK